MALAFESISLQGQNEGHGNWHLAFSAIFAYIWTPRVPLELP